MRELIIGDAEFRKYMDVRWGVDLLGQKFSQKGTDAAMDAWYWWDPAIGEKQVFYSHADHEERVVGPDKQKQQEVLAVQ